MSHKKFGPDRFSRFDVYWIQTDRQTDKQTDKPNLYIDLYYLFLFFAYICYIIGQTPYDAKGFGEIYWEENDIILVLESRVGICLKTKAKFIYRFNNISPVYLANLKLFIFYFFLQICIILYK